MNSFVDCHCDSIVKQADNGRSLYENDGHLDIVRLREYDAPVQIFAIWLDPRYYAQPKAKTLEYIDHYYNELEKNKKYISHCNSLEEIRNTKKQNKISAILAVEGGEALEGKIDELFRFFNLGVRAMNLTWNHKNHVASGAGVRERDDEGLTVFGRDVVREMEGLGMIVDVSHLSDKSFWDVYKTAKKPFIAGHSNARAVCNVPRNLTDDQLKAIADRGGIVGLNFYPKFIADKKEVFIEDILRHAEHMLNVMGEDHIALGSDFDGIETTPVDICHVGKTRELISAMEKEFGKDITAKAVEKNMFRIFEQMGI